MNKRGNVIIGGILIILGGLFLLVNANLVRFNAFDVVGFTFGRLWPSLFLIIPGLSFHYAFFGGRSRDAGLLVPGGILLVLGITFQINMLFGMWHLLWPFYIMSVAVGLFELYIFGNRDRGLLIPVFILGGMSIVFLMGFSLSWILHAATNGLVIPVILIIVGLAVMLGRRGGGSGF